MSWSTSRLLFVALLAWAGCAIGPLLGRAGGVAALLVCANLLVLARYRRVRTPWLLCAIVAVCAGLAAERASRPGPQVETRRVEGRIEGLIRDSWGWRMTLASSAGDPLEVRIPLTGEAWLDTFHAGVVPGARVSVILAKMSGRRARALSARGVEVSERAGLRAFAAFPARGRQRFVSRARARLLDGEDPKARALLLAMVAGEKSALGAELREAFRSSGLAHIAVVSGMHVALIVLVLPLGAGLVVGRHHVLVSGVALGALGAAAGLLPSSAPVRRACLAVALSRGSRVPGRAASALAALSGAMILLLALAPGLARSWSFALTVSASLAIVLAAERKGRLGKVLVFLAPVLATWPLLVLMSGRASVWAPLANFAALPALPLALGGGWITVLLPGEAGMLLEAVSTLALLSARWIVAVAEEVSCWPGAGMLAAPVGPLWAAGHLGSLAVLLISRRRRWVGPAAVATLVLWAWPILPVAWPLPPGDGVYVLDVGQGQAVLLQEGGRSVLVDAADDRIPRGSRALLDALRQLGVRRLEGLVVSHADRDHAGGAGQVLSALSPSWLALPSAEADGAPFRHLAAFAARRGIECKLLVRGDRIGGALVLHPVSGRRQAGNLASVVLLAEPGGVRVLIPGDAPLAVEESILRAWHSAHRLDLLVAGHHGSRFSTGANLLAQLRPRLVAFSCGAGNAHAHPHVETVLRVHEAGAARWSTADAGSLHVSARGWEGLD